LQKELIDTAVAHGTPEQQEIQRRTLLETEPILAAAQPAFSLFVIRHFGLIEILGQIPPDPLACPEGPLRDAVNCERMAKIATLIVEEWPKLQRILRLTRKRFVDAEDSIAGDVPGMLTFLRMLGRQNFHIAAHWIRQRVTTDGEAEARLMA